MSTLLHIDSSPMGGQSVSRHLSQHYVTQWLGSHPSSTVIVRDLSETAIPPVDEAWVSAVYTPDASKSPEQKALLALSDLLISELKRADTYVIGVPMHNFSIPSALKLWIDQISRVGQTFTYVDGAPQGLLPGKKATIAIASGGNYDEGTAMASLNHAKPYLRSILGFLGVTDISFVDAGGTMALRYGQTDLESFLRPHFDSIRGYLSLPVEGLGTR